MTEFEMREAIAADQLRALRKAIAVSCPVNTILATASLLVAAISCHLKSGVIWFLSSQLVNFSHLFLCWIPVLCATHQPGTKSRFPALSVQTHLFLHVIISLCAGLVWGSVPFLCEGYTSPQTLFYLTMICGITAGSATYGFAYAWNPICFFTPTLLSLFVCLVAAGGFQRDILAATTILFLAALIRGTRLGEALVINESRLKNEAMALSQALTEANQKATGYAMKMQRHATHDMLTGLLNRRGFAEQAAQILSADVTCCLLVIDLDGFKSVNDVFGHHLGDQILIEVAGRLQGFAGKRAAIRLGGDEFAILVDDAAMIASIEQRAASLIEMIGAPFEKLDVGRIGACIGIYVGHGNDLDKLMMYADTALYAAKRKGRNNFTMFDNGLRTRVTMCRDVERDLLGALEQQAVSLWYQPILSDTGRRIDTFEALLRWNHPIHGWISPLEIISAADRSGSSGRLLHFIIEQVSRMMLALVDRGLDHVRVAINISARELVQLRVDDIILAGLQKAGISPAMLEVEITEEVAVEPELLGNKLARLAEGGVRLAIDDFGTGYSSLGVLQKLQVDRIKIDKVFVTGQSLTGDHRSLLDAVLRVSQAYGFEVVAEGVETEADLNMVQALGYTLLQGFYFARPMPQQDSLRWTDEFLAGKARQP